MKKRFISMALALCMALTLLPMTVFAAPHDNVDELTVKGTDVTDKLVKSTTKLTGDGDWSSVTDLATMDVLDPNFDDTTWGKIVVNPEDADDTTKLSRVVPSDGYGARAWLVAGDHIKDLQQDFRIDDDQPETIDDLSFKEFATSLDRVQTISGGELLIVALRKDDDGSFEFYTAGIVVEPSSDRPLKATYNDGAKDQTISEADKKQGRDDNDNTWANKSNFDLSASNPYQKAYCAEGEESVAVTFETWNHAKIEGIKIVTTLEDATNQNVRGAYLNGENKTFENGSKLGLGKYHIVVKVVAQDGKIAYYVYKIEVVKNAKEGITDAAILVKSHAFGNKDSDDRADFEGDFTGGLTAEEAKTLVAKIPNSNNQGPQTLTNVTLHLLIDGDYIVWERQRDSIGVDTTTFAGSTETPKGAIHTTTEKWIEITGADFTEDWVFFVKVVKKAVLDQAGKVLKPETERYYKLVVQRENDSKSADIISGKVIGDYTYGSADTNGLTELGVTADIEGLPGGEGNYKNPTQITATLPINTSYLSNTNINSRNAWKFYEKSRIELTVDDGASVKWLLAGVPSDQNENWEKQQMQTVNNVRWNSDGTKTYIVKYGNRNNKVGDMNLNDNRYVYFFVTAEDGHTTKVYELSLSMAGVGSQAVITDVIPTNGGRDIKGFVYSGLTSKPSSDYENPTEVEVLLPYGGAANQLSARFLYSAGATLTFKDTPFDGTSTGEKTEIGIFKPGDVRYIKVVSQNLNAVSYYKLVVRINDIKVNEENEGSAEVDLAQKLLIIKNGEVTVNELKDMLTYVGSLKVKDAEKEEVFGSAKVGTGYTVEGGNVTLTVVVLGDTNGDGLIVPSEASKVLDVYAGNATVSGYGAIAADANQDGSITPADASTILDIYAK